MTFLPDAKCRPNFGVPQSGEPSWRSGEFSWSAKASQSCQLSQWCQGPQVRRGWWRRSRGSVRPGRPLLCFYLFEDWRPSTKFIPSMRNLFLFGEMRSLATYSTKKKLTATVSKAWEKENHLVQLFLGNLERLQQHPLLPLQVPGELQVQVLPAQVHLDEAFLELILKDRFHLGARILGFDKMTKEIKLQ